MSTESTRRYSRANGSICRPSVGVYGLPIIIRTEVAHHHLQSASNSFSGRPGENSLSPLSSMGGTSKSVSKISFDGSLTGTAGGVSEYKTRMRFWYVALLHSCFGSMDDSGSYSDSGMSNILSLIYLEQRSVSTFSSVGKATADCNRIGCHGRLPIREGRLRFVICQLLETFFSFSSENDPSVNETQSDRGGGGKGEKGVRTASGPFHAISASGGDIVFGLAHPLPGDRFHTVPCPLTRSLA